ncbi:hypothetical protein AABB24_023479 [Solanum stoloniferum]|uniref:Uncharacterized protein n=1 Tax=Solanum stoloniferum TaxID=62892 RepID=A0ABD2SJK8_9SOLN
MGYYLWGKIGQFRGEIRIENLNFFASFQGNSGRDSEILKRRKRGRRRDCYCRCHCFFRILPRFGRCLLEKKTLAYKVRSLGTELGGRRRTRKGSGFGTAVGSLGIVVEN